MTLRIARLLASIGALMAALALLAALLLSTPRANAQGMECGNLSAFIDALKERYGEEIVWSGVNERGDGSVRSYLLQSPSKSWTLLVSQGTTACIIGSGNGASPMVIGRDA